MNTSASLPFIAQKVQETTDRLKHANNCSANIITDVETAVTWLQKQRTKLEKEQAEQQQQLKNARFEKGVHLREIDNLRAHAPEAFRRARDWETEVNCATERAAETGEKLDFARE